MQKTEWNTCRCNARFSERFQLVLGARRPEHTILHCKPNRLRISASGLPVRTLRNSSVSAIESGGSSYNSSTCTASGSGEKNPKARPSASQSMACPDVWASCFPNAVSTVIWCINSIMRWREKSFQDRPTRLEGFSLFQTMRSLPRQKYCTTIRRKRYDSVLHSQDALCPATYSPSTAVRPA
jgi:hypothetical protein